MKVYFVATIRNINKDCDISGTRVVGYFEDLETAKKCVRENWCDIYKDGYYKYAIIEDIEPGLYMSAESNPQFYKWVGDANTGGYRPIKRPRALKNIFGFTIG